VNSKKKHGGNGKRRPMKLKRIHVHEYIERIFASNLLNRDRKQKGISKVLKKHGGDGKRRPLTPSPFPWPWPWRPPAIETPLRQVPARPLISWPENASCSRITMMSDDILSAPTLPFSSRCRFWVLKNLCSNLSQPRAIVILFYCCWITKPQSLNLRVCLHLFLFCLCNSKRNGRIHASIHTRIHIHTYIHTHTCAQPAVSVSQMCTLV